MIKSGARTILRFSILFLVLFALLAWPFTFLGRGYRFAVGGAINALILGERNTSAMVRLVPNEQPGFEWYLITKILNPTTKSVESQFDVDVYQAFCLPTAVFAALTLAGRYTWGGQRVVLKLLVGIFLLQLRGSLRFVALERALAGIEYGFVDLVLLLLNRSLVAPLGMAFALPLLLWFGLSRRSLARAANRLTPTT
jgi:hypothetical protein